MNNFSIRHTCDTPDIYILKKMSQKKVSHSFHESHVANKERKIILKLRFCILKNGQSNKLSFKEESSAGSYFMLDLLTEAEWSPHSQQRLGERLIQLSS